MALQINGEIPKNIIYNNQQVKKVIYNNQIVWQKSRLPSDYQEVEWIESTGQQYIDTGFVFRKNNGFYIDFVPESDVATTNAPNYINAGGTGGQSNKRVGINCYKRTDNGELQFFNCLTDPKITKNQRAKMSVMNKVITYNDESTKQMNITETYPTASSMIIFAAYDKDITQIIRHSKMKLYNLKIYDGSDVVRDYIPCYRKSDREIGLYELVEGNFLINQGTGTFNKGLDI